MPYPFADKPRSAWASAGEADEEIEHVTGVHRPDKPARLSVRR
jgi:hypothetical protein